MQNWFARKPRRASAFSTRPQIALCWSSRNQLRRDGMVRKGARSSLRRELTRRVAFVSQRRILLSPFHPFVSLTLSPSTTELWIEREKQKRNASCTRTHKKTGAIVPWIQKENRKHQPQTSLRRFPSSIFKEWTDKMKSTRVAVSLFYICIIFTGVCVFFENDKEIDITYYFIVTSADLTFYILQIS